MKIARTLWMVIALLMAVSTGFAQSNLTFDLMTSDDLINRWPGNDYLIGNAGDIVFDQPVGSGPSDPNKAGALSFFTVTFPEPPPPSTQLEFIGEFIRFCTGTIDVQATLNKGNTFGVSITGGTLYGTTALPLTGPSITTLGEQFGDPDSLAASFGSNMLSGTFDHSTLEPDFEGGPMTFSFPDQIIMGGTVEIVKRANFGLTGDTYLDFVGNIANGTAEVTGFMKLDLVFTQMQSPDTGLDGTVIHVTLVATTEDEIPILSPGEGMTPTPSFTLTLTPSPSPTSTTMSEQPTSTETPTLTLTLTPVPPTSTETLTSTPSITPEQETPTLTVSWTPTHTMVIDATSTITPTFTMTCSADFDRDMDIDFQDLLLFIQQMQDYNAQNP
jgi:hypothetical protein